MNTQEKAVNQLDLMLRPYSWYRGISVRYPKFKFGRAGGAIMPILVVHVNIDYVIIKHRFLIPETIMDFTVNVSR